MKVRVITLDYAIRQRLVDSANRIIIHRSAKELMRTGIHGITPLMKACQYGMISTVKLLLSKGVDINQRSVGGWTAIFFAVRHGRKRVYDLLVNSNALSINTDTKDLSTLLDMSIDYGDSEITMDLLNRGTPISLINTSSRISTIERAACSDVSIIMKLIELGATPNPDGMVNFSPLLRAINGGAFDNVKFLLKAGANVNVVDPWGRTALEISKSRGDQTITDILISYGASEKLPDLSVLAEIREKINLCLHQKFPDNERGLTDKKRTYYLNSVHDRLLQISDLSILNEIYQTIQQSDTVDNFYTQFSNKYI